jgi:hypothetical protein
MSTKALYDVPATVEQILDAIAEDGGQITKPWKLVLDALKEDFDESIDGLCKSIRNREARAGMLKEEIARLQAQVEAETTRAEQAKALGIKALESMEDRGQGKKYGKIFQAALRDNPPSCDVLIPGDVPDEYVTLKVQGDVGHKEYAAFMKKYPHFVMERKVDKRAIIDKWKQDGKSAAPAGTVVHQKKKFDFK